MVCMYAVKFQLGYVWLHSGLGVFTDICNHRDRTAFRLLFWFLLFHRLIFFRKNTLGETGLLTSELQIMCGVGNAEAVFKTPNQMFTRTILLEKYSVCN